MVLFRLLADQKRIAAAVLTSAAGVGRSRMPRQTSSWMITSTEVHLMTSYWGERPMRFLPDTGLLRPRSIPSPPDFNVATKYVLSRGDDKFEWKTTHKLSGIDAVKKLKATDGPDLLIQGSSTLSSQLFSVGLIDRMHIVTYPVVIGKGKRLFAEGTLPGTLKLVSSAVSESGAVLSIYEPTGQKPTLSSRDPEKISDAEIKRRERVKREG